MSFPILVITALLTLCAGIAVPPSNHTFKAQSTPEVYTNCKTPNNVALTFDDGPYKHHLDVATTLQNAGIKGTFFVNGNNWDCIYDPNQVHSLQTSHGAGHQIASHTWSHPNLIELDGNQIHEEFAKINLALHKILGIVPAVIRPPYGNYNDKVRQVANSLGQSLVTWNFDSGDSTGATPEASKQAYTDVANRHQSTIISLQHETINATVFDVLPFAIKTLKDKGYNFVTISECLGMEAYKSIVPPSARDDTWIC